MFGIGETDFITLAIMTVMGVLVGSFLNVVIYRARTGKGIGGRSMCLSCGKMLTWRELVPLLSFLVQKGRCRGCGTRLSWQYPTVEFLSGLIAGTVAWKNGLDLVAFDGITFGVTVLETIFFWTLLSILAYDLRHKIIPDAWVAFAAGIGLLKLGLMWSGFIEPFSGNVFSPPISIPLQVLGAVALAAPFAGIWYLSGLLGSEAMGLGDAKMIVALGWFLGVSHGITTVILAFWIASVPAVILLSVRRSGYTMKSEIPFGPFLAVAAYLVYMSGFDLLNITW
jgi:leader peptidase (prepilin peptidase)/N-methyltransferase